jgi:beta propeller repeat protein
MQVGAASAAPVQITNLPANQGRPDIEDNIIVWKDIRAGNWDIYSYNLLTGIEEAVNTDSSYQNLPITNGTIVVWQDNQSGNNDIYMKDLATGVTELLVSGPGNQGLASMDGGNVVYIDDALGNNNIYMIELDTRAITSVSTNQADQWQPRISGTRIVWEDERNGNWDIYMRDMPEGDEVPVAAGPGNQRIADIDGDIVVWQDHSNGIHNIRMKNLDTGLTEMVTDDSDYQNSPRVSNDLIVWENYSYLDENYDIFGRDLTTGETLVIAGGSQIQARPSIDGETVVWEEVGASSYNIWMERIADVTTPQISHVTPNDGENAGCQAPVIEAAFSDNRTGVDIYSLQLVLDDEDVTADATITETELSYQAPVMEDGAHSATVTIRDLAGNTTSTTWQFSTSSPLLELELSGSLWASYEDYLNRELTVRYYFANTSSNAASVAIAILAAPSTSGVLLVSPPPIQVGAIDAMADSETTVKYLVPQSIISFRSSLYLRTEGACGIETYYPGLPLGS